MLLYFTQHRLECQKEKRKISFISMIGTVDRLLPIRRSKEHQIVDFLKFKKMVTPLISQILCWMKPATYVIMGIVNIAVGVTSRFGRITVLQGINWLVLNWFGLYCDLPIVTSPINDTPTTLKNLERYLR